MSAVLRPDPVSRPDVDYALGPLPPASAPARVSPVKRVWRHDGVRRAVIVVVLAALWEVVARWQDNDLLLPSFLQAARALVDGIASGELVDKIRISMSILLMGYGAGVLAALVLTALAASTRIGRDLLSTLAAMFNPLPPIALLPLALLWFGLGRGSLIFVLVHSVLWPLALNTFAGFQAVPETLRMTGRNYGLRGARYVLWILVPAALPSIISGLRIGWAFAWRTLIAAELVFGASSGKGGLGWYIFQNRNELQTDRVFAGLACVVLIGLVIEGVVFRAIERVTTQRWGMQR